MYKKDMTTTTTEKQKQGGEQRGCLYPAFCFMIHQKTCLSFGLCILNILNILNVLNGICSLLAVGFDGYPL